MTYDLLIAYTTLTVPFVAWFLYWKASNKTKIVLDNSYVAPKRGS